MLKNLQKLREIHLSKGLLMGGLLLFCGFLMTNLAIGQARIEITEIWSGNEADGNLTEDWFEIVNQGTATWTPENGALFYDDDSSDPTKAKIIEGLTQLAPGEVALVVVGAEADAIALGVLWADELDLTGIEIGYTDGPGLGGGSDAVTLWLGDPNVDGELMDFKEYPDTEGNGGKSYDVLLAAFSEVGNTSEAVATTELASEVEPATGSPGILPADVELSLEIVAENDAVEEDLGTNAMYMNSSDLELGSDGEIAQRVGVRFTGITLPANAVISSAYIQFTVDEADLGNNQDPCVQTIYVEDAANSEPFIEEDANLTARATAATMLEWEVPTWTADELAGEAQRTPDLTGLINGVLMNEEWMAGNAISFFFEGSGTRTAIAVAEGQAPKLVIKAYIPPAAPEVVAQIGEKKVTAGWSFSIDLKPNFLDIDSELQFAVSGLRGADLPEGVSVANGVLSGVFAKPGYYNFTATATEVTEGVANTVSQDFVVIAEARSNRMLKQLGTVKLGAFDEGAAEISAYDASTKKLFVTNAETGMIDVVDMTDPTSLSVTSSIDVSSFGDGVTSVAVANGKLAAAIPAANTQDNGKVVAWETSGDFSTTYFELTVGALPDMVTFNEDGTMVLVANEGEPSSDYTNDPEGSVSVIDVANKTVATANFQAWNGMEAELALEGVRIFGPNASVAQDLEPEYITVLGDSAYVSLQENNAIAIVQVSTATVKDIHGLGYKDHSLPGNGLDAPDADGIDIASWPVKGAYMPDAISGFKMGGKSYILSANEGDAREYDAFEEETEIGDVELDPETFDNIDEIQSYIGGLKITAYPADTTADGKFKSLYAFGARSFSIWDEEGNQVFDSGDDFEHITAAANPANFNASNTNFELKNRSDDKGPEPEAITLGTIDGVTYAFIGLERMGGLMVYDVTDPTAPEFVEYFNNRNFDALDADAADAGDSGPEGLVFIPSADSPNGQNLLVVSNEVSGTVTVYSVGDAQDLNPFTLAIFHNNDGESALLADSISVMDKKVAAGSIGQFVYTLDSLRDQATDRGYASIMLSSGDNFLPGQTFNASNANGVYYDAIALDSIDYDAICLGNHDFDFGAEVLAEFIGAFETNKAPYLTSNLSFENVASLQALVEADRIAPSTVIERDGQRIGVVGLTTPEISIISSPGNTTISEDLVAEAQAAIDALVADGVNKIILISHLQGLEEDLELIPQLTDVDIVIAGGGDELLSNNPTLGEPYNLEPAGNYPLMVADADEKDVYIVTTPGNYRFLGNLLVDFDVEGNVTRIYDSNPVLVKGPANQNLVEKVEEPIRDYIKDLVSNIVAVSEVDLDFRKPSLRTGETNAGNLFADALFWQAKQSHESFGVAEPHVAIQNGGGLRIERIIEAGDFNENLTYEIAAFTNIVSVVEAVSPEKFLELMEWGLAEAPVSNGRFPQIAGFKIVYDQGLPAGERVLSITLDDDTQIIAEGAVVEGAPDINLATIDFTANGGDGYPFEGTTYTTLGATYQQAFLNYLTDEDGLDGLITEEQYALGMNERILVETSPLAPVVMVSENFDYTCPLPEGWTEFHDGLDLVNCAGGANAYIDFNGYAVGVGTSYVITPRVEMDGSQVLSFDYLHKYGGPLPEVLYSTDYPGYGDPSGFTWTNLAEATDSIAQVSLDGGDAFAHVEVSLADITSAAAIAFKYTSEGDASGESRRFRIDNVIVTTPQAEPLAAISETFEELPTNWFEYNTQNDLITYFSTDNYYDFNGYGVGAGEAFLTTPVIDFSNESMTYEMSFDYVKAFGGPEVQVLYSADYPGYGNPVFYEWDTLAAPSAAANVETASSSGFENTGAISLAELSAPGAIAFAYASEGDAGGQSIRFRLDSLVIRVGNHAPTLAAELSDLTLDEGFASSTVDLSEAFADEDDEELTFSATSSDEAVVTVSVDGSTLTVAEVGVGSAEVTVIAEDAGGFTVSDVFVVTVDATVLGAEVVSTIEVYPNPTTSFITLSDQSEAITHARVYNTTGQLVHEQRIAEGQVDFSWAVSGTYLIKFIEKSGKVTGSTKVVRQ